MSSPIDVIKEYLIKLGFDYDRSSFDNATKAIDLAGESLAKMAGSTVKNFAEAGVSVAGFFAAAIAGIAKFINGLGNAQIQYEMLSRQMWTTQQNAEAFSTTLKAMGRSLNDLYLSPTLMQQFQALNKQAFEMMPPADYQQQMQFIQNISFQFTRMKLEGTYALQWIGYYFIKYMAGPLANIQVYLQDINDTIIKTMPYWTKVVAEVMSWFGQFGVTAVEAIKDTAQAFKDVGQTIPTNIKLIGLAILGLAIIMSQGPLGWTIDAIVALGLAVNDFFTYIHGGQSEFGPFWQKLIDLYNRLKNTGEIDKFKNAFKTAMKDISQGIQEVWNWIVKGSQKLGDFFNILTDPTVINIFMNIMKVAFNLIEYVVEEAGIAVKNFYKTLDQNGTINNVKRTFQNTFSIIGTLTNDAANWFKSMYKAIGDTGVIKNIGNDVMSLFKAVSNVGQAFSGWVKYILGLKGTNSIFKDIGDWITSFIINTLETVDTLLKQITSGFNGIADLFQGKWGDMFKNFGDIFTKDVSPMKQSYIYPSSSNKTTNNSSNVSMTNNFTITGSDPNATASAATNNLTTVLRNTKGVIY